MTTNNYWSTLRNQIVSPQGAVALLGMLGAARRRRRSNTGWIVGGIAVAAGAALLFGTARGRSLSSRFGSTVGSALGDAVGGVVGAHPVKTAQLVDKAKQAFASNG